MLFRSDAAQGFGNLIFSETTTGLALPDGSYQWEEPVQPAGDISAIVPGGDVRLSALLVSMTEAASCDGPTTLDVVELHEAAGIRMAKVVLFDASLGGIQDTWARGQAVPMRYHLYRQFDETSDHAGAASITRTVRLPGGVFLWLGARLKHGAATDSSQVFDNNEGHGDAHDSPPG